MQGMILFCYLGIGAIMDGRKKEITFSYLWTGVVLAIGCLCSEWSRGELRWENMAWRFLPGLIFLVLAYGTRERIGYGDGMLLCILGACIPYPEMWYVWCLAVVLLTLWAGLLLCMKKVGRNTPIPFLPFLWGANLLVQLW